MIQKPTTQEIKNRNQTNFQTELNQNIPDNKRAFFKVLSAIMALSETGLWNLGIDRAKASLAITAIGDDLDDVGGEYGVLRKAAVACVAFVRATGQDGTSITPSANFVSTSNGLKYAPGSTHVVAGGLVDFNVTAEVAGESTTLNIGGTLNIESPIAGLNSEVIVQSIVTVGADAETDDDYRIRVLDVIRTQGGGGNAADYRLWAQEVAGVGRAYPYSGRSSETPTPSSPPDRTVFVEATGDAVAPAPLLDQVRDSITTDPETGLSRQPLGTTDGTLFIESVSIQNFDFQVRNLEVASELEADCKAAIISALTDYSKSIKPYIEGLDLLSDKNDIITQVSASEIVENAMASFGANAETVFISTDGGTTIVPKYELQLGQIGGFGGVVFV